jgi:hydrogenase maturation protease
VTQPRVLVAGVGNIFNGDDAFGVEVANRLLTREFPEEVRVGEYGIRGVHLAYELLEGYDTLILVDALSLGEPPGTVVVLQAGTDDFDDGTGVMDAHSLDPAAVLNMLGELGGGVDRVFVVGCEPANVDDRIGLSPVVDGAVDEAVRLVCDLVAAEVGVG